MMRPIAIAVQHGYRSCVHECGPALRCSHLILSLPLALLLKQQVNHVREQDKLRRNGSAKMDKIPEPTILSIEVRAISPFSRDRPVALRSGAVLAQTLCGAGANSLRCASACPVFSVQAECSL